MPSVYYHARRALVLALLGAILAACSEQISTGPAPTPALPSTAVAGATATAAPAIPTAAPASTPRPAATAAPAIPTTVPIITPIIGFQPQTGGPGTSVNVFGSGYGAGSHVAVRLGLPQPTGEVLASAVVDANGRWGATLVIPDRLPSGDSITSRDMFLVAMDEGNRALASAPFGFIPPAEPAPQPAPHTPPSDWAGHWEFAMESDANLDGIADTIFYSPAEVIPEATFGDQRLADVAVVAAQIRIIQPVPEGLWAMLTIEPNGAYSGETTLFSYGEATGYQPTGYLLALDPARGPLINLIALGPDGTIYGKPIGINWNREAGGFRVADPLPQE
jgi:hypothetical protein